MSTVTLSKPHCAITSAENPDGIASKAFTTAVPEPHIYLTLFASRSTFPVWYRRHCEECCDEAIRYFRSSGLLRRSLSSDRPEAAPSARGRVSLSPPRYRQARARRSQALALAWPPR